MWQHNAKNGNSEYETVKGRFFWCYHDINSCKVSIDYQLHLKSVSYIICAIRDAADLWKFLILHELEGWHANSEAIMHLHTIVCVVILFIQSISSFFVIIAQFAKSTETRAQPAWSGLLHRSSPEFRSEYSEHSVSQSTTTKFAQKTFHQVNISISTSLAISATKHNTKKQHKKAHININKTKTMKNLNFQQWFVKQAKFVCCCVDSITID